MRKQITLAEVIMTAVERHRNSVYHVYPGIVVNYYPDLQEGDIQPAVNDVRFNTDTGEIISEPFPVIPSVPIAFPRSSQFAVAWPLKQGDHVVLVAFDLDPTKHRLTGNQEDPVDVGRHAGSYWVAFPADITDTGKMQDSAAAGSAMVIGADGQNAQIRINQSTINLGANATDSVALASKVNSALNDLATAIQGWTPASGDGGAALKTALTSWLSKWSSGSVASSLVKSG